MLIKFHSTNILPLSEGSVIFHTGVKRRKKVLYFNHILL